MGKASVFVDTSGFLALADSSDEHHRTATALQQNLRKRGYRFITSDYVIDESVTLLLVRHSHRGAANFLETVEKSESLEIEWVASETFFKAAALFRSRPDKEWSFTDCTTFIIMKELKIREALTSDHHFKQAGFTSLLAS